MAETKNGHLSKNEQAQVDMIKAAETAAAATIANHAGLSPDQSRKLARSVINSVSPWIRAELLHHLGGMTRTRARWFVATSVATLAADLAVFTAAYRAGGRRTRIAVRAAAAAHIGLVAFGQYTARRLRAVARTELDRDSGVSASRRRVP